jgi:hypothetical protein
LATGIGIITINLLTVQGLRQNSCNRRLAHTASAGKQISMVNPAGFQAMSQCLHHMFLANKRSELPWPPFSGQHLMLRDWVLGK